MPPFRETSFTQNQDSVLDKRTEPRDPFLILGLVFMGISIFISIISYGYNFYLSDKNTKDKQKIESLNASLSAYPLKDMLDTYNKVINIDLYTKSRNYISSVLYTLETVTEKNVYFKKFVLSETKDGYYIEMEGVAPDYKSIVRQMDGLKDPRYSKVFNTVTLDTIIRDGSGNLTFAVKIKVNTNTPYTQLDFAKESSSQASTTQTSSNTQNNNAAPVIQQATSTNI
jgi:hypothetical protein